MAAFGVAGPIINQSAEMTNVPWQVDAAELSRTFSLTDVHLLNDLEAMAYSLPVLEASELQHAAARRAQRGRQSSRSSPRAPGWARRCCIASNGRYVPIASEGGHTDFAARTDRELELVTFLRAQIRPRRGRARRCAGRDSSTWRTSPIRRAGVRRWSRRTMRPTYPPKCRNRPSPAHVPAASRRSRCSCPPTAPSPATSRLPR